MAKGESPLKQFEVQPIVDINVFGLDLSFTNSALWMTITTIFIIAFFTIPFFLESSMAINIYYGINFITNCNFFYNQRDNF